MGGKRDEGPTFAVYESVRCLECGTVYSKPTRGGTARANPGCPGCGYVGWISVNVPVRAVPSQRRSDEGPQLGRSAQSH
jgi:predicted  nucleic acid-binding Zn-ribbon protein